MKISMTTLFCTLLVRFEKLNKALFENRFISSVGTQHHFVTILSISCGQVFGGHKVELMATATQLQVPVYCCYTNLSGIKYHWEAIKPIYIPANCCIVSQPDDSLCTSFLFCLELNTAWILHSLVQASLHKQ